MTDVRDGAPDTEEISPWPALWALVIGFFMILVDSTIVSVATPSLMSAFGADINEVLWVTSAYLLAYAVPLLVTGRLGDRFGPKRVYLTGLTVFTIASLWCGMTGELDQGIGALIAARVLQGLGASMMTPQTMAVITRTFPAQRRGSAMALWGATAGVATLAGPLLGGILVDTLGWEWIFFVNVPVGVVGFVLALRLVPRLETHARTVDLVGVALSAVGLFCFVFGLQEAQAYGWGTIWGPVSVPLLLGVGVALLGIFVWWQSRTRRDPLVPLSLFSDRNFSLANVAITTMGFAVTAMIFPFMIWAQDARGMTPTQAALLLAPQSILAFVIAPLAGKLTDQLHPRLLAGAGTALFSGSLVWLAVVMGPQTPVWQVLVGSTLMGLASPFVWGPVATTATRNLPPQLAGAGSGVYNTTRQMGAVVGSASIAMLMQARLAVHAPGSGLAGAGQVEAGTSTGTTGADAVSPAAVDAVSPAVVDAVSPAVAEAVSRALAETMLLPAAVLLVGTVAAVFFERPRHLRPAPGPAEVSTRD